MYSSGEGLFSQLDMHVQVMFYDSCKRTIRDKLKHTHASEQRKFVGVLLLTISYIDKILTY